MLIKRHVIDKCSGHSGIEKEKKRICLFMNPAVVLEFPGSFSTPEMLRYLLSCMIKYEGEDALLCLSGSVLSRFICANLKEYL